MYVRRLNDNIIHSLKIPRYGYLTDQTKNVYKLFLSREQCVSGPRLLM